MLHRNMYLQDFLCTMKSYKHTHTEQTVFSTDSVVENHMIKVTAVCEYGEGCDVAPVCSLLFAQWSRCNDHKLNEHPPTCSSDRCAAPHAASPHTSLWSLLIIYKMAVVRLENKRLIRRLCSLFVALFFAHRWSSNRTRFKRRGSSSIQKYSTAIFLS